MSDLDWEKPSVLLRAFRFDSMTWWQVLTLWSFPLNDSPHLQMIFISIPQDSTRRRARIAKSSGSCWNCWIRWMALTKIPLSRHGDFLRFGLFWAVFNPPVDGRGWYYVILSNVLGGSSSMWERDSPLPAQLDTAKNGVGPAVCPELGQCQPSRDLRQIS
jgi:hypothetical protein